MIALLSRDQDVLVRTPPVSHEILSNVDRHAAEVQQDLLA